MSGSITALAPAKINLGLNVFPRRDDGYHDVLSIFSTVALFDEVSVSRTGGKRECIVRCEGMELPEQNTVAAAYKAFCVLTGIDSGVSVSIRKRIPAGGGLGGGSSDASSFIQAVNSLFDAGLGIESLSAIAENVGSDVCFFTHALFADGGRRFRQFEPFAAVVEGRGERVRQIAHRSDFSVLLVFPETGVSTGAAYELLDRRAAFAHHGSAASLEEMYRSPVCSWRFENDFTVPVCECYPAVRKALSCVRSCGADFADMSGSGSTVFGIFAEKSRGIRARKALEHDFKVLLL